MRQIFLSVFLLLIANPLFADVYIKSRVMGGMGEAETWTGGKKQRISTQVPIMGGEAIEITRPDKGVKWEIRTALKAYSETPIPIEYAAPEVKEEDLTKEEKEELKKFDQGLDQADKAIDDGGECKSAKISEQRTFAGIKAEGYQATCKEQKTAGGILWISAPGETKAEKMQKEINEFEEANFNSLYSKYPPNERARLEKLMKVFGSAMAGGMIGIPTDVKDKRDRLILAMVSGAPSDLAGRTNVMMEVVEAEIVPADKSRFEIPEGFQKVTNLADLESQYMMSKVSSGEVKLSDMVTSLGQAGQRMGMPLKDTAPLINPEGMTEANGLFRAAAQDVQNMTAGQGTVPVLAPENKPQTSSSNSNQGTSSTAQPLTAQNSGLPPQTNIGNSFGAYDNNAPQQPYQQAPQQYQQQPYPPQQQYQQNPNYQNYPPQQYQQQQPQQQNRQQNIQQTLAMGQQLITQVQQLASGFQGGGSGYGGGGGFPDMGELQNYGDGGYDDSGGSYDSGGDGYSDSGDSGDSGEYYEENSDSGDGEVVEETVTRRVVRRRSES